MIMCTVQVIRSCLNLVLQISTNTHHYLTVLSLEPGDRKERRVNGNKKNATTTLCFVVVTCLRPVYDHRV